MRPILAIGILLLVLGAIALAVPSFTYFTTERVADVGFFKIDVSRPHTIIINPIVGGVMLLAGVVLVIAGSRRAAPLGHANNQPEISNRTALVPMVGPMPHSWQRRYPMKQIGLVAFLFAAVGGAASLEGIQPRTQQTDGQHEHFLKCAKACADCQVACDSCFHHCADLVAKGKTGHVKAMHACVDCADYCALAAKLTARHSMFSTTSCEGCAKVCDECAKECEKFQNDKHMLDCAKSCRDCGKACRTMIGHLK